MRAGKIAIENDVFIACRNFNRLDIDIPKYHIPGQELPLVSGVNCSLYGKKKSCRYCPTCPRCAGKLSVTVIERRGRFLSDEIKCVSCGMIIEVDFIEKAAKKVQQVVKGPEKCAVEGCESKTWDKKRWKNHLICISHHNQIKTWKRTGTNDLSIFPLLDNDGKITINPRYRTLGGR
jgi:hypothetical protein